MSEIVLVSLFVLAVFLLTLPAAERTAAWVSSQKEQRVQRSRQQQEQQEDEL